jgi:hypothetical protein
MEINQDVASLLAADAWNRFVPWGDIVSVRVPGLLPPRRIEFHVKDEATLRLWAWNSKDVDLEHALDGYLTKGG